MMPNLIKEWQRLYRKKTGFKYPVSYGRHGKLLKVLAEDYESETVVKFMELFLFKVSDDFLDKNGYKLEFLRLYIPKLIEELKRGQRSQTTSRPSRKTFEKLDRARAASKSSGFEDW